MNFCLPRKRAADLQSGFWEHDALPRGKRCFRDRSAVVRVDHKPSPLAEHAVSGHEELAPLAAAAEREHRRNMLLLRAGTEQRVHDAARNGLMQRHQLRSRQPVAAVMRPDKVLRLCGKEVLVAPQLRGGTRGGGGKGGIELVQHGHDRAADAVAADRLVRIRAVLDVGRAGLVQKLFDLRAREPQQRPDDLPAPRRDAAEPRGGRAAREIQEHRLGVVVGVVGGRNKVIALLPGDTLEKSIAQLARRLLEPQTVFGGIARHVGMLREAGDAVRGAVVGDKGAVAQTLPAADAVLEVRGGDSIDAEIAQQRKQAHRIRPA